MSAITNSSFSFSSTDIVSLETKGSKGSKGGRESRGSRPETKRNLEPKNQGTPGTVLPIQYGPIPPRDQHVPNVMYIDPSSSASTIDAGKSLADGSEMSAEQHAAAKTVMSWKSSVQYSENACGSSFSGKSGPITYDGVKSVAVGSSSDGGFKSTAVYSTGNSASNCSIS